MDEDALQDWMNEELSELDDTDKDSDYEDSSDDSSDDNSDDSGSQSGSASDDSSDGEIQMNIDNDNGQANIPNNDNDNDNGHANIPNDDNDNNNGHANIPNDDNFPDNDNGQVNFPINDNVIWSDCHQNFAPRMSLQNLCEPIVTAEVNRGSSVFDVFHKIFPTSLIMFIVYCTNERLKLIKKKKGVKPTDIGEIMIVLGCMMIMCYNRLPNLNNYWSKNSSLGNAAIKAVIARDRCKLLLSKLYFNIPQKPAEVPKTYYTEEILACLKSTFMKCRSDSGVQSIDESMAKFKGRSSLKQYLPMKPVKRGIKIWQRCDAKTGYTYDMNIYSGKELGAVEGTLGERVVMKLAKTIKNKNVALIFDRFFTSVRMIDTIEFAAIGTCIATRKNVPVIPKLKQKYESRFLCNNHDTLFVSWLDTKQVTVISNCHTNDLTTIGRKGKDGKKQDVSCPEAIKFYNANMGGVDLADQMSTVYDVDRKSAKWWKKVFYKLLLTSVVNSWIIYKEIQHKDIPLLDFLVELAESLIANGRSRTQLKRRPSSGPAPKRARELVNVGDHLPVEIPRRRRCFGCSSRGKEKRTKTLCEACNHPFCMKCFAAYHK